MRGSSDPLPPQAASSIVAGLGPAASFLGLRRSAAPPVSGSEDPRTQWSLLVAPPMSDMPEVEAAHLVANDCVPFATRPWVEGPTPLSLGQDRREGGPAGWRQVTPRGLTRTSAVAERSRPKRARTAHPPGERERPLVPLPFGPSSRGGSNRRHPAAKRRSSCGVSIGGMNVTPLSAVLGGSIDDVDLATLADDEFETVYRVRLDRGVLPAAGAQGESP